MVRFTHRELRRKNTDNNGVWDYVCRQSVLSMYAKQERSTLCQGIDPRFTCCSGLKMVTVLTELPWHQLLGYFICFKGKMVTLMRKYHARCGRVCVCVCSSSFHVSKHWTDFHEILGECCALAGYIVAAPLGFLQSVLVTSRRSNLWGEQDAGVCFFSVV